MDFSDSYAIDYKTIVDFCRTQDYGDPFRIQMKWYFLTGSRMKESDNMKPIFYETKVEGLYKFFWEIGKNQTGWRWEIIDQATLNEYYYYRQHNAVPGNKLFAMKADNFRTRFNKEVRPTLNEIWHIRNPKPQKATIQNEYETQLKGLRKSHSILKFHYFYQKFGDYQTAMEFTCAAMKHKNRGVTVTNYLMDYERLNKEPYISMQPWEILRCTSQKKLKIKPDLEIIKNDPIIAFNN